LEQESTSKTLGISQQACGTIRPMTPEERFDRIERQVEFLATHQAQLSTSLEALTKVVQSQSQQIEQTRPRLGSLAIW
jgi:hypothetical protein